VVGLVLWTLSFMWIAFLVERRWSVSIADWIVIPVALALGALSWSITRIAEGGARRPPRRAGAEAFPIGAFVAGVVAYGVGVAVRSGLDFHVRGGSADLAHHSAVVNVLAAKGASGYQDALASLRYYPIGAHLPAALFARVTGMDALSTTYLFSQMAVVGLFAAVTFVALQLRPRHAWATVAVLVWIGAAWKPIFLDSVMFNFFYSQEVGLAFVVATVGFAMSPPRPAPTSAAWMVFCATAVGACYPTYIVLVVPVMCLWLVQQQVDGVGRRLAQAAAVLSLPLLAALLSVFLGPGSDIAGHEGFIQPITASTYFGGAALLFLALFATISTFARTEPDNAGRKVRSYVFDGPWAMIRLWFALSLVFLGGNWLLFRLGVYGSRYNTVKCIYPVAAGLAVMLGVFVGNVLPDNVLGGLDRRVRPFAVCAAVAIVAIWAGLFRPVASSISPDQIGAVEFARDTGTAFAPVAPDAIDYILAVALVPLDPGSARAPAILFNDSAAFRSDDLFVDIRSSAETSATVDGAPLSAICHFGTATVYARVGSPAMSFADRCPSR
jgi:hypothetical protein